MRRPLIAANWKMHKTVGEAEEFLTAFLPEVRDVKDADIVIAPPFTALYAVGAKLKSTNVSLSAQDVFYETSGAYTGEVAPGMLKDVGCEYVIVGHSERRQYFGESDEVVNKKTKAAMNAGLTVICCIGESLEQRKAGKTNDMLEGQLKGSLKDLGADGLVIAYEPIWAIGTGVTATPELAQEAHAFIRGVTAELFGDKGKRVRILYGGSVKPENVDELMACPDIDGALVGGASLKPDSFARLVKFRRSKA